MRSLPSRIGGLTRQFAGIAPCRGLGPRAVAAASPCTNRLQRLFDLFETNRFRRAETDRKQVAGLVSTMGTGCAQREFKAINCRKYYIRLTYLDPLNRTFKSSRPLSDGRNGMHSPNQLVTARQLLTLEPLGADVFRAPHNLDNLGGAAFGGQLFGQSLAAANSTVGDKDASSFSAFFLRSARLDLPIEYHVERISDGQRVSSRQVVATQDGRAIFRLQCAFQQPRSGLSHQADLPVLSPPPEELLNRIQIVERYGHVLPSVLREIYLHPFPIEMRPLRPDTYLDDIEHDLWLRFPSAEEVEGPSEHRALLAIMSDYGLPGTIVTRHKDPRNRYAIVTLNHSLWFHRPALANDWLLYRVRSNWAGGGRGLAEGSIFDRSGKLVATVVQEAILQPLEKLDQARKSGTGPAS